MTSEGQHGQPAEATSGDGFPPDTDGRRSSDDFPNSYGPPPQATPNGGSPFVVPAVPPFAQGTPPDRYGVPATPPGTPPTGSARVPQGSARVPQPTDDGSGSTPRRPSATDLFRGPNAADGPAAPASGSSSSGGSSAGGPAFGGSAAGGSAFGGSAAQSAWAPPPAASSSSEANPFEPHPYQGSGHQESDFAGFAPGSPTRGRVDQEPSDSGPVWGAGFGPADESNAPDPREAGAQGRPPGLSAFGDQRVRVPGATLTDLPDAPPVDSFGEPSRPDAASRFSVPGALPPRGSQPEIVDRTGDSSALPRRVASEDPTGFGAPTRSSDALLPRPEPGPIRRTTDLPVRGSRPTFADEPPFGARSESLFDPPPSSSRPLGAAPTDPSRPESGAPRPPFGGDTPYGTQPGSPSALSSPYATQPGSPSGPGSPYGPQPSSASGPGSPYGAKPGSPSPYGTQPGSPSAPTSPYGAPPSAAGSPHGAQSSAPGSPYGAQPGSPNAAGSSAGAEPGSPYGQPDSYGPPSGQPAPYGEHGSARSEAPNSGNSREQSAFGSPAAAQSSPAFGDPGQPDSRRGAAYGSPSEPESLRSIYGPPAQSPEQPENGHRSPYGTPAQTSGQPGDDRQPPYGTPGQTSGQPGNDRQSPYGHRQSPYTMDSSDESPYAETPSDSPYGRPAPAADDSPYGRAPESDAGYGRRGPAAEGDSPFGRPASGNGSQFGRPPSYGDEDQPPAGGFAQRVPGASFTGPGSAGNSNAPSRPESGSHAAADYPGAPGHSASPVSHANPARPGFEGDHETVGHPRPSGSASGPGNANNGPGNASNGPGNASNGPGSTDSPAAPDSRDGAAPRGPAEAGSPAKGTARPVSASASVPMASRVGPAESEEAPPPAQAPQARVYGRPAPPAEDDPAPVSPFARPRTDRPGAGSPSDPGPDRSSGDPIGGVSQDLPPLGPKTPPPGGRQGPVRASASARVAPPSAPDQESPTFNEFTDDVAGRGRPRTPDNYGENTTDMAGRSQGPDQPYVPAPALPTLHARPPLVDGFPPAATPEEIAQQHSGISPDRPRLGGVFPGPSTAGPGGPGSPAGPGSQSRATVTPPGPDETASWPGPGGAVESDQGRFDQFKPDAEPAAPKPETPHVRMLPVLLGVILGAALLVGVSIGVVWLIARGSDNTFSANAGDCVKRSGDEAVKATCGDPGTFTVVSKVDTKEQCPDPGQPYVLNPTGDGKTQVLCLKPSS